MEPKEPDWEALLQKYYEGETSLEEENALADYLRQHAKSRHLRADQQWFEHRQKARQADVSTDFERRTEAQMQLADGNQPGKQLSTRFGRRAWLGRVAAVLVLGLGIGYGIYRASLSADVRWVEQTTSPADTAFFALPDGSQVWLNAGSKFRYPASFEASAREVWLDGEAFFEVAKDPHKPFRVHTSQTLTEVLGTSFNVRGYADEKQVEVAVVTGKVAFASVQTTLQEKVFLQPGNGAVFIPTAHSIRKVEKSDPNQLAWKTHRLVFEDRPLREVIRVMERYFRVHIDVESEALLHCRFRGTFREASLKEMLDVMAFSMQITTTKQAQGYRLSGPGCR